jgi:hypothetical protein
LVSLPRAQNIPGKLFEWFQFEPPIFSVLL